MRIAMTLVFLLPCFAAMGEERAANLIQDGGFETPVVPDGGLTRFSNGQMIGPWTVVGATGNVDLISTTFTFEGFTLPAKSGQQWLDLTGDSQTATGVAQSFTTKSGSSYTLKFSVGSVYDKNGQAGTSSTVYVMNGSTQIYKAVAKGKKGSTSQTWHNFSVTFVASSATTTLSFINGDPSTDTDCGLDAVSVSAAKHDALLNGLHNE
jgi:hypothetical protein